MPSGERWCTKCLQWVDPEAFAPGRSSQCRSCHAAAVRAWRVENRDWVNAKRRADYRAEHPLVERDCLQCGQPFVGRPDALVCGAECRQQRKRVLIRERGGSRRLRTCEICRVSYRPTYRDQRTCGRVCGVALKGG